MINQDDSPEKASQLIEVNEKVYKLLIDSVTDYAIFMLDPAGRVMTWNAGAERIKGYTAGEIVGRYFAVFYPPDATREEFPRYELRKALEDGRFEDEGWRIRKDGSRFWANVVITPLYDEGQIHIGYAKVTRDLTQRLRNEELMKKNQELLRINTDLDNFIYTASHDLKAPILNVEGLLKALQRQLGKETLQNETVRKLYSLLYSSVDRFKATIRNLTEVARIGKESQEDVGPIALAEVLAEVLADLESLMEEADARLEAKLDCGSIHFSRKNLKSIVHNLLSNAIKFRAPDRPLRMQIACQAEGDYQVLSVADNGLGLDVRQQEKLFGLFKRLHPYIDGVGIGLYMVKRMLAEAGGRIEVESQAGVGSIFRVYFKL
jgi:PAS domain S-box-containing protein